MTTEPLLRLDRGERRLYLAIVQAIRDDIRSGRLSPGDRLPTHRDLADDLGVAVGTVTRADLEEIAKVKMEDLGAASLDAAVRMIAGTARSSGIAVEG